MSDTKKRQSTFIDWWYGHVERWNKAAKKTRAPDISEFATSGMLAMACSRCAYDAGFKAGQRSKRKRHDAPSP